ALAQNGATSAKNDAFVMPTLNYCFMIGKGTRFRTCIYHAAVPSMKSLTTGEGDGLLHDPDRVHRRCMGDDAEEPAESRRAGAPDDREAGRQAGRLLELLRRL